MKKFIFLLLCLLLTACNSISNSTSSSSDLNKLLVQQHEKMTDAFTFTLQSAKEVYTEGELVDVVATLTNNQTSDITIGHGASWVIMSVTNLTEDFHFGAVTDLPYIVTTIKAGETLQKPYRFSGGSYSENQLGKRYSDEEMKQMTTLQFPQGKYEIEAAFSFTDEVTGEDFSETLTIIFEIGDL